MKYTPVIGLEIHTELKTRTKMFCGCLNPSAGSGFTLSSVEGVNDPNEKHPNINICPICLGHPGTLPTINKKAVEAVLKLGLALNAEIPEVSKFDRKNYFYPDLPKGYQISQYDKPLALGGALELKVKSSPPSADPPLAEKLKVSIRRIHLEEDTGRLLHSSQLPNYSITQLPVSLVDFNRAGVPLMELVTEPDIKSGEEAVAFAKELQLILRYLDISDADMEKGQMRIEANISLREIADQRGLNADLRGNGQRESALSPRPTSPASELAPGRARESASLGTKVEIKNLNSFKAVEDAISYEIRRQAEVLEEGGKIIQETRGWDENKKQTVSQRQKEESHDYRYFPEPDLPIISLRENGDGAALFNLEKLSIEIPELPAAKRIRFAQEYGLSEKQVEILTGDRFLANYFEEAASELGLQSANRGAQIALFNYLTTDLLGLMNQEGIDVRDLKITPEHLAHLAALLEKGDLTSRMAKDILLQMFQTGLDPHQIIKEKGMAQISGEDELKKAAEKVMRENPAAAADFKKGKSNALQFLVGKAMGELRGRGNPEVLIRIFKGVLTKE